MNPTPKGWNNNDSHIFKNQQDHPSAFVTADHINFDIIISAVRALTKPRNKQNPEGMTKL
ncbi:hypothetical protein DU508_12045 [Pedobacter chinensis]|uniref:Uncharacterized protein n=1 Tax=Pedobacter chinensis TaxID=2282421 RepID=A0A369Q065_9SPHI|nr:hypothetical protein DU508_12045 [Pedobacter chinensis]